VAISSLLFSLLYLLFMFLRMGTVALTAQAVGARDALEQQATLFRAILLACALGLMLVAMQWPIAAIAYPILGASDPVTDAAKQYFWVRIWSAPFSLVNYVVLGWLTGLGRATLALALQIVISTINTLVAAVLVLGFGFGVVGAGTAAAVSEIAG